MQLEILFQLQNFIVGDLQAPIYNRFLKNDNSVTVEICGEIDQTDKHGASIARNVL